MVWGWLATTLAGLLPLIAASLVARVLFALGMGFVTYTGFAFLLDYIKDEIVLRLGLLPSPVLEILGTAFRMIELTA